MGSLKIEKKNTCCRNYIQLFCSVNINILSTACVQCEYCTHVLTIVFLVDDQMHNHQPRQNGDDLSTQTFYGSHAITLDSRKYCLNLTPF